MESIREIICLSHDGIDRMWYPFSAELDTYSSVISTGNYYEIGELLMLIQSMFATNNYSPEMVNGENYKATRKYLVGEKDASQRMFPNIQNRDQPIQIRQMLLWELFY